MILIKILLFFQILALFSNAEPQKGSKPKEDDVVMRICRSNPDYSFCRHFMANEMKVTSPPVPFPHMMESGELKEGAKKKILLIKNEYNPDGTVKIPPNITLDEANERELAKIKSVHHASFQPMNNWGFENAPELKTGAALLPDPAENSKTAEGPRTNLGTNGNSGIDEKELFNFPLPPLVEHVPLPRNLPDHRVLPADRNGLLAGIGDVNVGFNTGVGVPGVSDGVSVGTRVGVSLGNSGPAGDVPYYFTNQGERFSLNDYDGGKNNIVPDRALKHYLTQTLLARQLAEEKKKEPDFLAGGVFDG